MFCCAVKRDIGDAEPRYARSIRFITPSTFGALQVEQSDEQIESLALSDKLDTADKRSSALAGERCWQGSCLCCMPNGVTYR